MTDCARLSVTVVVAAYNAVPFIGRALASALGDGTMGIEVIVVDDASIDGTSQFVRDRFGSDPRVEVITLTQNVGPAAARNVALARAQGRWIAVLDADDAFEPGHLLDLVALGEAESADIVSGNFVYFDVHSGQKLMPGLDVRGGVTHLDRYEYASGARPYTAEADFGLLKPMFSTAFLRRHALLYPVDVRHGEDMELVLCALVEGARFVLRRDLCTYLYTTRDSGHSRTPVNYAAQVRRTLSLRRRPKIKKDSRLTRLLTKRAEALQRLELDRNWSTRRRSRFDILRQAMLSAAGRRWFLSRMVNKLAR